MRKSFHTLSGLVNNRIGADARDGDVTRVLSHPPQACQTRRYDDSVVYKFDHRLWGIFTHCIVYDQNDGKLLEFKLAFDNYSRFIFYDEAGIMVDVVSDYFGRNSIVNYESVRKRIVSGDTETSINWEDENVLYTLKADPERHRPELYIEITIPFPGRAAKG